MAKKLKQKANSAWEISVEDAGNVWDALKNPLHNTLDMAGIIPGADILHAGLYAAEGNPKMAALYTAFGLPFIGDLGQYGRKISNLATRPVKSLRAPISKAWVNIKNPGGAYTLPTKDKVIRVLKGKNADIKGPLDKSRTLWGGLKKAIINDEPLYANELTLARELNFRRQFNPKFDISDNRAFKEALNQEAHKSAAEYHLNRELHNLPPKNFKGHFNYIANPKNIKNTIQKTMIAQNKGKKITGTESFKFNIPRSKIFNISSTSDKISDVTFANKGKFWKYNKDNKYAKELDYRWQLNHALNQVDPVVGNFGKESDRLWDTWNMSLNPGESLYKAGVGRGGKKQLDPVKLARHYGSKVLGLDEVKLVSKLIENKGQLKRMASDKNKFYEEFTKASKSMNLKPHHLKLGKLNKKQIDTLYKP